MVTTFEGKKYMFTKRSIKSVTESRKIKHILMIPEERKMTRIDGINIICDSPVSIEHIMPDSE